MKITYNKRFCLICVAVTLIVIMSVLLIGYYIYIFDADTCSGNIECRIGEIVEYDGYETDLVFVDNCPIENIPIIEMTSLRTYVSDDFVREYEENDRFGFKDSGSYLSFRSNQEELKIFEVELIVSNRNNFIALTDVEWVSTATNDIVVAECDSIEDTYRVEAMEESVYSAVVITTQRDISKAQLKQLITDTGLKLIYHLYSSKIFASSVNYYEYSEVYFR